MANTEKLVADSFLAAYGTGIIVSLLGVIWAFILILGRIMWKSDQDKWDIISKMKEDQGKIRERLVKLEVVAGIKNEPGKDE